LQTPHIAPDNGLKIASLFDLAGTKAAVVQQRAEAKDYRDIDAIDNAQGAVIFRGWQSHPLTPGGPKSLCPSGS
jgi:hypothetical protein